MDLFDEKISKIKASHVYIANNIFYIIIFNNL